MTDKIEFTKTKEYLDKINKGKEDDYFYTSTYSSLRHFNADTSDNLAQYVYEDIKDIVESDIQKYFKQIRNSLRPTTEMSDVMFQIVTLVQSEIKDVAFSEYTLSYDLKDKFKEKFFEVVNKKSPDNVITLNSLLNYMKIYEFSIPYGYPRTIEQNMGAEILSSFIIPEFKCGYFIMKTTRKILGCEVTTTSDSYGGISKIRPMNLKEVRDKINQLQRKEVELISLDYEPDIIQKQIDRDEGKKLLKAI